MRFWKYHGTGNDFVMLADPDARMGPAGSLDKDLVVALCDRHTGVGADGVIRMLRLPGLVMDYYNADGGPAEMCGNGIRCLAVLAARLGWIGPGEHAVSTGAGLRTVRLHPDRRTVTVDMGPPGLGRAEVPMEGEGSALRAVVDGVLGTGVSMGNPHFVVFCEDLGRPLDDGVVAELGPRLEAHPAFPQRTNVELAEVRGGDEIAVRVWERGVGETLACGTGACAAAVAAAALGRTGRRVTVRMRGGELEVDWGDTVWMTGPAEEVFSGELDAQWAAARTLKPLP